MSPKRRKLRGIGCRIERDDHQGSAGRQHSTGREIEIDPLSNPPIGQIDGGSRRIVEFNELQIIVIQIRRYCERCSRWIGRMIIQLADDHRTDASSTVGGTQRIRCHRIHFAQTVPLKILNVL